MTMLTDLYFTVASEMELNGLLAGQIPSGAQRWSGSDRGSTLRTPSGNAGVLWHRLADNGAARPLAVVASPEDHRRLFNRFAQLRSDLSPISSWCHVFSPHQFAVLGDGERDPNLRGLEAPLTGLAIAEAVLLTGRPWSQLKLATCLATQTYALSRSVALWGASSISEILERYELCQSMVRNRHNNGNPSNSLRPIWAALLSLHSPERLSDVPLEITHALQVLVEYRTRGQTEQETQALFHAMQAYPPSEFLLRLPSATPEERVREFDALLRRVASAQNGRERALLTFLAGYLTTIVAGGSPSLGLAESVTTTAPQVLAWAYAIGGIGEIVTWTSSFDGMGRLVAREMMRTFRVTDAPACDFALDEALVLVDRALSDPFVHLRIKQSRVATVSLTPGVNIAIGLADAAVEPRRLGPRSATASSSDPSLVALADALTPLIISRLQDQGLRRPKEKLGKKLRQADLPLDE